MVKIEDKIVVTGKLIKLARLRSEWYEDVEDPEGSIEEIRRAKPKPDIFTFWQRLPDTEPRFSYFMEWDSIAVLPIESYENWFKKQINAKTRNMVRKAEKKGLVIKEAKFDDDFVSGMTDIFNETPVRQGKPFWHYGKDFETVKREFSRFLFREDLIGAYCNEELIGFIMLAHAGKYAITGQIISKVEHRDKAPNNALLAKAIEICEKKKIPYLVYAKWEEGMLGAFKRHNGFQKIDLPRYYIPLTARGKIVLKLKLHHGIKGIVPITVKKKLKVYRKAWFNNVKSIKS